MSSSLSEPKILKDANILYAFFHGSIIITLSFVVPIIILVLIALMSFILDLRLHQWSYLELITSILLPHVSFLFNFPISF